MTTGTRTAAAAVECMPMTAAMRADARELLGAFLGDDEHYRASAAAYGDGGAEALEIGRASCRERV